MGELKASPMALYGGSLAPSSFLQVKMYPPVNRENERLREVLGEKFTIIGKSGTGKELIARFIKGKIPL